MALRDFPNNDFAWFNDDDRLAILARDIDSSDSTNSSHEPFDTFQDTTVTDGIRLIFHSKYEEITSSTQDLKTHAGLDSGLHTALLCYVKARLLEDAGDLQRAQYFRGMYERALKQYPSRRSGVRNLSVPRL